jgi:hypothetical protein
MQQLVSRAAPRRTSRDQARRNQRVEFGIIYAVSFPVFLAAVIFKRLFDFVTWRKRDEPAASIFKEAREAAGSTVPYAFMG